MGGVNTRFNHSELHYVPPLHQRKLLLPPGAHTHSASESERGLGYSVYLMDILDPTGVVKHSLSESGLARVDVCADSDVSERRRPVRCCAAWRGMYDSCDGVQGRVHW